ncbi:MAG: cell division protein FtsZ [Clostridia bacterium]|nr:cell division protein FtsZ [Clostridia bacterium]
MEKRVIDNGQKMIKIKVIGVGGAGNNAINRMVEDKVQNVEFIAVNTETKILKLSKAKKVIQIGRQTTAGLSTGGIVEIGEMAARENIEDIEKALFDTDMVFITAGMGGGTGTGAAPVVAEVAKKLGILTVGVVTKPFIFEGIRKMNQAKKGIAEMKKNVDALIVISNDKLLKNVDKNSTIIEAFKLADSTLKQGIIGITNLLNSTGLVNVDFNDVKTVMTNTGMAHLGMCTKIGEDAIRESVKGAVDNSLSETKINGAKGVIINIAGSNELSLMDINTAITSIGDHIDENATVIFGTIVDESLKGKIITTVIATGVEDVE